jgi:hypothetical protein
MKHINLPKSNRTSLIGLGTFIFTVFLFSFSTTIFAQDTKANFSGTWVWNESKSTPVEGGFRMSPSAMTITQEAINLNVESTRKNRDGEDVKSTAKFTLDGKECSNAGGFGNSTRKSVLTWSTDGKTLNFAHSMTFDMNGETQEFKNTESWKLTDDKTLSVETIMNFNGEEMKTINVYDKK